MTATPAGSVPGSVAGDGRDAGVAWHYGDPFGEQRAAGRSAAVVDRSNRGVLVVPGADRRSWLHTISSQHLADLGEGESTQALVLSPKGHVEQHWWVTELGEQVWLDVEPGTAPDVLRYLTMMRFLRDVEPADVSEQWAVLSLLGPTAPDVLRVAGLPVPAADLRALALPGGGFGRRIDDETFDLVVPRPTKSAVFTALTNAGARPAGSWAYEARRVVRRVPRLGLETDHRTIPHEIGWIGRAVHLDKGCYRGQETVARVHNLGKPPRRLVLLHLAGESDELPEPGTAVELDGRAIGFLGTTVQHEELGPVALAVIKRSVPDDAALQVGGSLAAIDPTPIATPDLPTHAGKVFVPRP